jgi:succinoglycan biosynthesis transport protein ExoP
VTVKALLHAGRSGWRLITAGVLLGLVVALALLWFTPPTYSSSARLFVSAATTTDASAAYQSDLFSQQRVTSYVQLLTGEELNGRVATALGLDLNPLEVAEKVTARPIPDTVILEVTVTDSSPRRAYDIATALTEQFTEWVTLLETPRGSSVSTVNVTTVQPAKLDNDPVGPDAARYLAGGAVLGLLLGVAVVLVRNRMDTTVRSARDVADLAGADPIGRIVDDPQLAEKHLITALDAPSRTPESFRAIRTYLQFSDAEPPPRIITVTGSVPGEGTSTVALNLALVLALSGSHVLLVDADLRRPDITRYLGLAGERGLTDVLAGTADLDDVVQPWSDDRLSVLGAGPMPPDPSELLGSAPMRTLLETWHHTHDFVILDAPALLAVTDGAVLAALSDGCLLTTRFGKTRREQLAEAIATLARVDATLVGVVLNRIPRRSFAGGGPDRQPGGYHATTEVGGKRFNGRVPRSAVHGTERLVPLSPSGDDT